MYFAFNAVGFIDASATGSYTFSIPVVDDFARLEIDGAVVVENSNWNSVGPSTATITLAAGEHAFDLFYVQGSYGSSLQYTATSTAGSLSYNSAPEPASLALFGIGAAAVGMVRRRRA